MKRRTRPPKTRSRFATIWDELDYVCRKIGYWLYGRQDRERAVRYLKRLLRVLEALPENDKAIIRQEGWALFHELNGDIKRAIKHREKEIRYIERLHDDVAQALESGRYDEATGAFALQNRGRECLDARRAVLRALVTEDRLRTKG